MDFRDTGGGGPPVVFLHGLLVDGTLWDAVVDRLPDHRCVVPTLPLGSHTVPVADRSVLTPAGVADLVADLLERLDLRDVTVVASDTGGAIAQLLVTRRPERVSRLVLTPCDALEVFPPALFVPLFKLGRVPSVLSLFLQPLRLRAAAPAADRVRLADQAGVVRTARGLGGAGAARPRDPARRGALRPPRLAGDHARRRAAAAVVRRRGDAGLAARGPLLPDRSGPPAGGPVLGRAASSRSTTRTRSWPSTGRTCSRR